MSLPITPEVLRESYSLLSACEPFCKWNMPHHEAVLFRVNRSLRLRGHYRAWLNCSEQPHEIAISAACVGCLDSLLVTMAHEMIHLYQRHVGMETKGVEHNAAFKKLAERVCLVHCWDFKAFL